MIGSSIVGVGRHLRDSLNRHQEVRRRGEAGISVVRRKSGTPLLTASSICSFTYLPNCAAARSSSALAMPLSRTKACHQKSRAAANTCSSDISLRHLQSRSPSHLVRDNDLNRGAASGWRPFSSSILSPPTIPCISVQKSQSRGGFYRRFCPQRAPGEGRPLSLPRGPRRPLWRPSPEP